MKRAFLKSTLPAILLFLAGRLSADFLLWLDSPSRSNRHDPKSSYFNPTPWPTFPLPTALPSVTASPSQTPSPSFASTLTETPLFSETATQTPFFSETPTATESAAPSATETPSPSASATPTPSPSATFTKTPVDRIKGIFVLDSFAGTYRDGNVRNYSFVDGYAWRYPWSNMESATVPGNYNFAALDHIVARLGADNLKLSMIIIPGDPYYVTATAGVETWTHGATVKPRPWDPYAISRFAAFLTALANHLAPDPAAGGAMVALKNHSVFYCLNICIPGLPNGGIRDREVSMVDTPGYSRSLLIDNALIQNLSNARDAFPDKYLSIGFWSAIEDDGALPTLWTAIRDRILLEFDGTLKKPVGVFMDNLAAKRPCAACTPVTGSPTTAYAQSLFSMKDARFTGFQALTSWKNPSTQPVGPGETQADKVAFGTPMDGIEFALQNYESRYVELYVDDVDEAAWQADLGAWADVLRDYP